MKVSLLVTCLVDQMWTSIGVSSVEVLRRVGCEVEFDKRQTCCAQPALIEFLSESITLEPGDVIATGMPAGVGFARNPPVF